jgi:hypothetical protein
MVLIAVVHFVVHVDKAEDCREVFADAVFYFDFEF